MIIFNKNKTLPVQSLEERIASNIPDSSGYALMSGIVSLEVKCGDGQFANEVSVHHKKLYIALNVSSVYTTVEHNNITASPHKRYVRYFVQGSSNSADLAFKTLLYSSSSATKKNTPVYSKCLRSISKMRRFIESTSLHTSLKQELYGILQNITDVATDPAHRDARSVDVAVGRYIINNYSSNIIQDHYSEITKKQILKDLRDIPDTHIFMNFGKYARTPITELPSSYIDYMSGISLPLGAAPYEIIKRELINRLKQIKYVYGADAVLSSPDGRKKLIESSARLLTLFKEWGFTKDMWLESDICKRNCNIAKCIKDLYDNGCLPASYSDIDSLYYALTSSRSDLSRDIERLQISANAARGIGALAENIHDSPRMKPDISPQRLLFLKHREEMMSVRNAAPSRPDRVCKLQSVLMPIYYNILFTK